MKKGTKKWLTLAAVLGLALAPVVLPLHVVAALTAAAAALGVPVAVAPPPVVDSKPSSSVSRVSPQAE